MTFEVACPECSKSYKVRQEYAGKKVRCNNCQTSFRAVPASAATPEFLQPSAERPSDKGAFDFSPSAVAPAKPAKREAPAAPRDRLLRVLGGCAAAYIVLLVVGFLVPSIGALLMLCVGLLGIGLMLYGFGSFFMALERGQRFWIAAKILLRFVGFKLIYFDAALWNARTKRALGFMFGGLAVLVAGMFPAGALAKLATSKEKPAPQKQLAGDPRPPAGFPGSEPGALGFPGRGMPPGAFPGSQPAFMPSAPLQNMKPRDPPIDSLDRALAWLAADDAEKSGPSARYLANSRVIKENQASASMVADKIIDRWEQGWDVPDDFFRLLHRWVTAEQVPRLAKIVKLVSPEERPKLYSCLMKINSLEAAEVLEAELREGLEIQTREGHKQALSAVNFLCEMSVAEPVLLRWAGYPDSMVYVRVLHSLGRFGTEESLPKLQELVSSSPDPSIQSSAASAIRSIKRRLEKAAEDGSR